MELRARGTILQALDNEAKDADKGTQANSEDGGDTLLSPKQASNARDTRSLSARWWDESRPRKRGAIRPAPKSSCDNFFALLTDWLKARGLEDALEHKEDKDGFVVYRYTRVPLTSEQEGWETAFHGTRWYALWLILASGVLLESDDREAGHDFWEPGVYCSPLIPTARWYARPHIVFGDGVYHRALLEVVVDTKRRKRERMRGGVQWVFPREAVAIRAVWLEKNAPPNVEEQRFTTWDPGLEAVPPGLSAPKPVTNEVAGLSREEADPEDMDGTKVILPVKDGLQGRLVVDDIVSLDLKKGAVPDGQKKTITITPASITPASAKGGKGFGGYGPDWSGGKGWGGWGCGPYGGCGPFGACGCGPFGGYSDWWWMGAKGGWDPYGGYGFDMGPYGGGKGYGGKYGKGKCKGGW